MRNYHRRLAVFNGREDHLHDALVAAGTRNLGDALKELAAIVGEPLPSVELEIMWPDAEESLADTVNSLKGRMAALRVYLAHASPGTRDRGWIDAVTTASDASHLVLAAPSEAARTGWENVAPGIVAVYCPPTLWSELLVDIGIDIALFHWDRVIRTYDFDLASRQDFSARKAAHLLTGRGGGHLTPYGAAPAGLTYLPTAAAVRHPGDPRDWRAVANAWLELRDSIKAFVPPSGRMPMSAASSPIAVAQRIQSVFAHPRQISVRKVVAQIRKLPPGSYLFVRAQRRIANESLRKRLGFIFSRYEVGRIACVPADRLPSLLEFVQRRYLWVYPFEVR